MNKIFIIEHLEPQVGEWTLIEYTHISKIVGKENLHFTNVKDLKDRETLSSLGKVSKESVKELGLNDACILDPESPHLLSPQNARPFKYFIFGGILGDNPPRKRTQEELTRFIPGLPSFNIGKMQMSTDNAVYTVKKIIEGTSFDKIKFQDEVEIRINDVESTILPYRYAIVKGEPLMSQDLIKYLKEH